MTTADHIKSPLVTARNVAKLIRWTEDEATELTKRAAAARLTFTEYVRRGALSCQSASEELTRLREEVKALRRTLQPGSAEFMGQP